MLEEIRHGDQARPDLRVFHVIRLVLLKYCPQPPPHPPIGSTWIIRV